MWRVILFTPLVVAICAGAAVAYGAWRWRDRTERLHARQRTAREPIEPAVYHERELEGLPPPVQRYFRATLRDGQPLIAGARLTHSGTFNMGESTPNWRTFSSSQVVTTRRPGFVWDARVRMAPGLRAFVHDAYVAGEGVLHAEIMGLVTVADVRGTGEAAHGELLRYLAEAMWYPTALLPSHGISWTALDETSARAKLTDGTTVVSLDFHFGPDGLIDSTYAITRSRTIAGALVHAPWRGSAWSHEVRDGMRIPLDAEVAWIQADGPYPYWRGRITSIEYEYVR